MTSQAVRAFRSLVSLPFCNAHAFLPQITHVFREAQGQRLTFLVVSRLICFCCPCPSPQGHRGWTEWLLSGDTGECPLFFQIVEQLPWANVLFLVLIGLSLSEKLDPFVPGKDPQMSSSQACCHLARWPGGQWPAQLCHISSAWQHTFPGDSHHPL